MFQLLNIKLLAAAAMAVVLASSCAGYKGWSLRGEREAAKAAAQLQHTIEIERTLNEQLSKVDTARQVSEQKQQLADQRYADALRFGALRLSVPVTHCVPADPAASGTAAQTRAELVPEAAVRIDAIGVEGDQAVRDLNELIDRYDAARAAVNGAGNGR